ncbi:hypothetical protein [Mangrovimonas spongiae]|uniref:DUF4179 domain-containing protein n=1 Tax=Mangrovimonas spongiae TaxID=2494697 RepID=A0A428JVN9_9FLAO|nr:hypothetical protein [Mangrovimonas spongiae]RSK38223.1 hypothetical protein EJA19_12045 [Mangrovimonas spongiae]
MKDDIEQIFNGLKGDFDIESPRTGHEKRFINKLQQQEQDTPKKITFLWKPFVSIAAIIAIVFTLGILNTTTHETASLANVSPEMAQAESFFTSTITAELKKLNQAKNPETKLVIKDAMLQLNKLEHEYEKLKTDLVKSGQDQRVIYAMISNFQSRIDILQNTLKQIDLQNQLKNTDYDTNNTF